MKRRGILAAAGAVVAGIVAKQAAQPVTANDATWTFPYSGQATSAVDLITIRNFGTARGIFVTADGPGDAIFAQSGSGIGASVVAGGPFAIKAHSIGNTYGLYADTLNGSGVGVSGIAQTGVLGQVPNMANTVAVYGNNTSSTGANNIGVRGTAPNGTGIYGETSASSQYGILGTTYATSSTAIAGTCTGNGSSAFSGGTVNPNAFAAFFQGTTVVQGNFAVTGTKSAVIQHPRTGDHRLVYCVESPEPWFEDFGKAQLTGGKATVTFDPDFAALIHTDDYHVFLTEYGESNGLYVSAQSASGFVVQERNKGTSGAWFSWRVVGKRADTKSERLGKFVMPNLPLPDPAKFKAPETPTAATPKKP